MKKVLLLSIVLILTLKIYAQNAGVGINTTGANPHASAMLDVSATNKGFLVPRMTMTQRDGIVSPATSLIIYQTDNLAGFYYYDGTTWKILGSGGSGTETDPFFTASPAYTIATTDITNWNLAKSWGNHAGLYRPINYVPDWSEITNKPNLSLVATSNDYSDLLNVPWLSSGLTAYKLTGNVGIGTSAPKSKLVVQADAGTADGAALFVVKNKNLDTVLAVYNDGVYIFINDNLAKTVAGKGLVVKSTSSSGKQSSQEYFRVTNDSTVLYVNDSPAKTVQGKGILVKSTSSSGKSIQNNYMQITPDSTVFYINDSPTKATQGKGILVKSTSTGGKNSTNHDYMRISPDSTNFYIRENSGNGKGFAVKTLGTNNKDLLNISSDSTAFSTNDNQKHVVFKTPSQNNPLLNVEGSVKVSNSTDTLRGSIKWNGERFAGNVTGNQTGTFLMSFGAPALANVTLTAMTKTTIAASSNVTDDGGGYVFLKGFCWNTTGLPTRKSTKVLSGEDEGAFTDTLKNLTCGTTYHVRAYAINASSTSYSDEVTFIATFAPTVTTTNVTAMTSNTATCGGSVTDDGCLPVTARGVCWNTTGTPTIADNHSTDDAGTGAFTSIMTGLIGGSTYYYRAYATNSKGTGYSSEKTFLLGAVDYDGNVYNTVIIGTQIWMNENLKTKHFQNGDPLDFATEKTAWSNYGTSPKYSWYNYDINNNITYGAIYNFPAAADSRNVCPISWHVPSNAELTTLINALGGDAVAGGKLKEAGTTHWISPNTGADNSSGFSALPGGICDYYGNFGSIGSVGRFWSCTGIANGGYPCGYYLDLGNSSSNASGPNTFANSGGSIRCISDNTATSGAIISTNPVNFVQATGTFGGNITSDGGAAITARGVCWSTSPSPTLANSNFTIEGSGSGTFTSTITGLTVGTTYYLKAYATNSVTTTYGNEISFIPQNEIADYDGNVYTPVTIGTQIWLKENLKTTHYSNGDPIPNITDNTTWAGLTSGAYCWYNNDYAVYGAIYGALYNLYALTDSRNICPVGWHVPSDLENTTMTDYLGGSNVAGAKLKETGILHWNSPNTVATNSSGFSLLGSGLRVYSTGAFDQLNLVGYFWSTSGIDRYIYMEYPSCGRESSPATMGLPVRCVKNP